MRAPITYSMDEVKQMLGCEEDAVRGLVQDGLLASIKIGRSWIFPCSAFEASLNRLAQDDTDTRSTACIQRTARSHRAAVLVTQPIAPASRRRTPPALSLPQACS